MGARTTTVASAPEEVEPEALVVTHWFEAGEAGEPHAATIRLSGRRAGVHGLAGPHDTFTREETIERIVPGSGQVSVTTWVYGLQPGEWSVSGELFRIEGPASERRVADRRGRVRAEPARPAAWSWRRWALSTSRTTLMKTRWAPFAPWARIPAVIPGIWPVLGTVGIVVALLTQAVILGHEHIAVGRPQVVSLVALAAGLAGAKLWHAVLHPGPWRQAILGGWAVDGFLVVAPVVALVGLLAVRLPAGQVLDASAPGLFFAVAIGRVGCFFAGCCAGRCTNSRWGVWSSDRRVGARRVPTQLLESGAGLIIGLAAALLVHVQAQPGAGLVFALGFAAYLVVRQGLLRLRAESREYLWRRSLMSRATL